MEAIFLAIRLSLRRAWRGIKSFLDGSGLAAMPPVPTILALLLVGLCIPMALGVDRIPEGLSPAVARTHLAKYSAPMPATSPAGGIYSDRPVFVWTRHPRAARYRFRLREGEVWQIRAGAIAQPADETEPVHYLLPAPGVLKAGTTYEYAVEAVDRKGATLGQIADGSFSVKDLDAEIAALSKKPGNGDRVAALERLKTLRAEALHNLGAAETALVLAGAYAGLDSVHDVRTALLRYLAESPRGSSADLCRDILGR